MKYKDYDSIPMHVFTNKECTQTPSKELREYLEYMFENHRNDLAYLWRYHQKFTNYGGGGVLSFEGWQRKLERDLEKARQQQTDD